MFELQKAGKSQFYLIPTTPWAICIFNDVIMKIFTFIDGCQVLRKLILIGQQYMYIYKQFEKVSTKSYELQYLQQCLMITKMCMTFLQS